MADFSVEVCAVWLGPATVVVGLPLTPGWQACARVAKGGFFPVEAGAAGGSGALRPGKADDRRGTLSQPVLRPSVCHGLLLRAGVRRTDLLLDPMCGVGSLPAEAVARFGVPLAIGGDNARSAIREAAFRRRRIQQQRGTAALSISPSIPASGPASDLASDLASGTGPASIPASGTGTASNQPLRVRLTLPPCAPALEVLRWDAAALPLRPGVVDKLVVDVPWGNRGRAEPALLRGVLGEVGRVLSPDGLALVLLLRATARALAGQEPTSEAGETLTPPPAEHAAETVLGAAGLAVEEVLDVCVGGWPVAVMALRRHAPRMPSAAPAAARPPPSEMGSTSPPGPTSARQAILLGPSCCACSVEGSLAPLGLAELLVAAFPSAVPSISNARRAIRHRRVSLASDPSRVLWWREPVPRGERVVLRPHLARLPSREALLAMHEAEPLRVLWESKAWVCVLKPAGMGVLQGRRSLANALLALQASRQEAARRLAQAAAGAGSDGHSQRLGVETAAVVRLDDAVIEAEAEAEAEAEEGAEAEAEAEEGARAEAEAEEAPWTVAYDGEGKLGGAWLCAKTAAAALALLEGRARVTLSWATVLRGDVAASSLAACGLGSPCIGRIGRSVRYSSISAATFTSSLCDSIGGDVTALAAWRERLAACGHPVVGDRPHCDGPSACLWIAAVQVEQPGGADAVVRSADAAPQPERFGRLFEREEAVCTYRDQGQLTSEYVARLLREREVEEAEESESPLM